MKVITAHRNQACYVPLTTRTCVFIGLRASRQVVHCLLCIMQLIIRFMRLLFGLGSRVSVCSVLRDPDRQSAYSWHCIFVLWMCRNKVIPPKYMQLRWNPFGIFFFFFAAMLRGSCQRDYLWPLLKKSPEKVGALRHSEWRYNGGFQRQNEG